MSLKRACDPVSGRIYGVMEVGASETREVQSTKIQMERTCLLAVLCEEYPRLPFAHSVA